MYTSKEFDLKNPLEKYKLICSKKDYNYVKYGEKILLALYAINKVLIEEFNRPYFFYIYEDISCKTLIEKALNDIIDDDFYKNLIEIDLCKLIYRFTCARKFKIEDTTKKQLRLNSWGNEYIIKNNLIERNKEIYKKIYMYFKEYYNENKKTYEELLNRLLNKIDDENAEKIEELNDKLIIKILS